MQAFSLWIEFRVLMTILGDEEEDVVDSTRLKAVTSGHLLFIFT